MVIEGQADSIGQLLAEVDRICREFKPDFDVQEEIWYRGQSRCDHSLQPSLYRPETAKYHYNEVALHDRFEAFASPLVSRTLTHGEWYFLARHHGLPSRLLDWTESLLNAVYFAVSAHLPKDRLELDDLLQSTPPAPCFDDGCPVVWVLDAGSLNLVSLGHDAIVVPDGPRTERYLPIQLEASHTVDNAKPIALMPPRGNPRLTVQQGMFTLHGHERTPIEELAVVHPELKLGRVRLNKSHVAQFCNELRVAGVHRFSVFPDLDSLAAHVCWHYQSKI